MDFRFSQTIVRPIFIAVMAGLARMSRHLRGVAARTNRPAASLFANAPRWREFDAPKPVGGRNKPGHDASRPRPRKRALPRIPRCHRTPRQAPKMPRASGAFPSKTFLFKRPSERWRERSASFKASRVQDRLGRCRPKRRECYWCKVATTPGSRTSQLLRKRNQAPPRRRSRCWTSSSARS
jgi:hypothetical protein